jgi:glucokinase
MSPPTPSTHYLAVEIGGTKLQLCVGTGDGRIVDRRRFAVDRARGGEGIREQIAQAAPELIAQWSPAAIGVGYGGPVDWRTGRIWKSYHIAGWSDFPLGDWLRERTGLPVFAENDTNLGALGEARCGAGQGANPVFYTNMGSGVGGGLIIDGRIYHGAAPTEMEFGHLRLYGPERILEDDCAGWSLDRAIRTAIIDTPDSPLARLIAADPGGEARHLAAALEAGDPLAQFLISQLAGHLANALGVVTQLLNPAVIVIGGGVSLIGEPLRSAVAELLPNHIMDILRPGPPIRLAGLREDSVPVGALLMAADRLAASNL